MSSSPLRQRVVASAVSVGSPQRRRQALAAVSHQQPAALPGMLTAAMRTHSSLASPTLALLRAHDAAASAGLPPGIVSQWDLSNNDLAHPHAIKPTSTRHVNWQCRSCGVQFRKRVRDHCFDGGACPSCSAVPANRPERRVANMADTKAKSAALPARDPRILSPMLAHRWDKHSDKFTDVDDIFVSPKLDGVRCLVVFDPVANAPYFMSRNGNVLECGDLIARELMPAFARDPTLVLDGELYTHDLAQDFGSIIAAVKVQRANRSIEHLEVQQKLQLHCFDVLYAKGIDGSTPFSLRLGHLERELGRLRGKRTALVDHILVTKSQINALHDDFVSRKYEGIMLRLGRGQYEYGRRSMHLLKMKTMQDDEFKIVDVIPGKGRLEGTAGAILCETKSGQHFKANFGVTDDGRAAAWAQRQKLVGHWATIQYQEMTPAGVPRFGVFKAIRSNGKKTDWV